MYMSLVILQAVLISVKLIDVVSCYECVCGVENAANRIVGGTKVSHHKYPWTAYIVGHAKKGWQQCGGVLINDRYVMTAAHCLIGMSKIRVSLGHYRVPILFHYFKWMLPFFDGFLETNGFIIHPDYNETLFYNDISLLRLSNRVDFNNQIRPICLPGPNMTLAGQLIVTGWGKTETKEKTRTLHETLITEYPFDQCNEEWDHTLDTRQFCAADVGKDACIGDSGGPVAKIKQGRYYAVGVVSFGGATVCGVERNSVHSKVEPYVSWIKEQTKFAKYCHD